MEMKRKMKGVTWKPNKQRWVVEFKSENKLRYYGSFKMYCEAVRRASEVWLTLPIAKRKIKTCEKCGKQGVVPHQFEFKNTMCKECKSIRRNDKWIQWSAMQITMIRKRRVRHARLTGWVLWAQQKQSSISTREKYRDEQKAQSFRSVITTWDDRIANASARLANRTSHKRKKQWDRKAKSWTESLIRREKQRLRMNCDC